MAPALRALALIRGRVLDSCASRLREIVDREVGRATPHFLTRAQVAALLRSATCGLLPEADEQLALQMAIDDDLNDHGRPVSPVPDDDDDEQ